VPSPNVEAVRRGVEAWDRKDIDAMLQVYDAGVEVTDPERAGVGPFRGHDGYRRWLAEWMESWEHYDVTHEAIVDAGEHVVLFEHHIGVAKGSGIALDHRGALLVRVRDGKVVLHRPYTHRADALSDAGLSDGESWRAAIERVIAGYAAWNRHDVDALAKMMEPGVEFVPIEQSISQSFTGPQGMREFFDASQDAWEDFQFKPISFIPIRDSLLVELDVKGTARSSGIVVEEHWAHVYVQREGRLMRFEAFRTPDEAFAALAYPDQP
jgi:hypothetical protein